ncbi:MAG: hypothetical protein JWR02_3032 [Mucilaginibacter sp.]|nr:hypothetical protein [Mucilaginibacter sp.]
MKRSIPIALASIGLAAAPFAHVCLGETHNSLNAAAAYKSSLGISTGSRAPLAVMDTTMTTSHYIVGEKPSGSLNGSNKVFTLAHSPLIGKDAVYLNGVLQARGTDYTISGAAITFTNAPFAGDLIRVIYYY